MTQSRGLRDFIPGDYARASDGRSGIVVSADLREVVVQRDDLPDFAPPVEEAFPRFDPAWMRDLSRARKQYETVRAMEEDLEELREELGGIRAQREELGQDEWELERQVRDIEKRLEKATRRAA